MTPLAYNIALSLAWVLISGGALLISVPVGLIVAGGSLAGAVLLTLKVWGLVSTNAAAGPQPEGEGA